jgi:hypothetical protein
MITFDRETKTVSMNLVDLEHCGFDHDDYLGELFLAGLNADDPELQWPDTLIVKMIGVKICDADHSVQLTTCS